MKLLGLILSCFSIGLATLCHADIRPQDIPAETFGSLSDISNVQMSPDGNKVSFFAQIDEEDASGTVLRLFDFDTSETETLLFSDNQTIKFNWSRWANNDKLLVSTDSPADRGGTPTIETRLMIYDLKTRDIRSAVPKRYFSGRYFNPQIQDSIVDMLPEDENHILLELDIKSIGENAVYKVSLDKKKISKQHRAQKNVSSWITDRQHRVRIGTYWKDTTFKILHFPVDSTKKQLLWEFERFSEDEVWPLGFDYDENTLYVSANHEGRSAVFRVNLLDPSLELSLVFSEPKYDVSGSLIYSETNKKVVGVTSGGEDEYSFWNPEYQALNKGLDKALPGSQNFLVSFNADESRYVALSTNDIQAGTFYVGDRKKKTLTKVAESFQNLPETLMSPKQIVSYKARDGLEIEAYVTLPLGHQQGQKHPTVIFPHGGPISSDGFGFNAWTQLFASRGYAVLQMNFRGSDGYGLDFLKAGLQNWGLAMQDDIADGTQWMIDQGYTDPEKICIVGGSYGGYAAMMGSVKTPDLYKCAISVAGVSDIAFLVRNAQDYTSGKLVKEQIGSNYKDLKRRSPVKNVDKIGIPLLLIHGEEDRVVDVAHSRKMHKAMKKLDKDVTYIELENGSHQLRIEKNRIATFKAMDDFLAEHLL